MANKRNQRQAAKAEGYHSTFELEIAKRLEHHKIDFVYEMHSFQWREKIPNAYCWECKQDECYADRVYTPDFFVWPGTPHEYVIEAKGIFTPHDRKIAVAMQEQHSDTDFRYLFYYDNKLSRKSKTRYTDWCAKKKLQTGVRSSMDKTLLDWSKK